jgi:hypothetical protein
VGEEAVPVIEPLLRGEDESIRLTAFRLIASILPEKDQHQIYLKTALDGVSKPMAWQLESVSKNMETSHRRNNDRINAKHE